MSIVATQNSALPLSSFTSALSPSTPPASDRVDNGKNLEWAKAKPWLESRLQAVLDGSGKTPEKDRNQAWNDVQTWIISGPVNGRADNEADLNNFVSAFGKSDLSIKMSSLGNILALTMSAASSAGKNAATAAKNWAKNLSPADQDVFFNAGALPDKNGRYEYKDLDGFLSNMSKWEQEWTPPPTSTSAGQLTRDEAEAIARLEAAQAQQNQYLGRLTDEYNNRFGATRTVKDTIELSGPGAKAAAKTLQTDGGNDVALKALETVKQVGEQQREWAKSLSEDDAKKPLNEISDSTPTPVAATIAQPGSVLSIAA